MLKQLFLLLLTCSIGSIFSQNIVKGIVSNQNNLPVPGVKVYLDSTSYGVITDYSGSYFLELPTLKTYPLHFSMLGMQDTIVSLVLNKRITELNISLKSQALQLESVEITAKKDKVGNSIIKKLQQNRKTLGNQFTNYTCETYLKTGLEKEKRKIKESDTTSNTPLKMSLIESISISSFISPNVYHEKIIAQHDYSDKEETTASSITDYFLDDNITPVQSVLVDPYLFFEKVQDGDFNLYQNMINLPKIAEHPITSPIGVQAFTNYKYKLTDLFFENGQKIYEVEVTPRFKSAPLFSGVLYIIDELWVIKSFNLSINSAAMPFFEMFNVIQDYAQIKGFWVPVRREFNYTIREEENYILANTRVKHENHQFNTEINQKTFKNELSNYSPDAFLKDSVYWNNSRPIQLKQEELLFIMEQVKIDSIKQSKYYLDSIDQQYNKITIGDVFLSGMGFRNRYKKQEFHILPILGSLDLLSVGGVRYNFGGSYSKKFENAHKIKISPSLNYGFLNKDLKPKLGVEYTFLPMKFGTAEIVIGNTYERITNQLSAANFVFGGNNSVQNKSVDLSYRQEIVNGLYGRIKFGFANKQPLGDLDLGPIMTFIQQMDTGDVDLVAEPIDFIPYTSSILEIKLQYRFKQKYIIKKHEKLIVGSALPELELSFRQGIPRFLKSDVSFNSIEIKVSDEITFGNFGDSKWKVIGGSFLNKNDLRIIEHKYFKQSDVSLLSNPLNSHQTLDTLFNTSGPYVQAFYLHHFNGFFLNKIPLINLLKFESIAGVSFLLVDELDYSLSEFFIGVERKFKLFNEYYKYGFHYVGRFDDISQPYFRFKIGFDYLNTFTNKWSY